MNGFEPVYRKIFDYTKAGNSCDVYDGPVEECEEEKLKVENAKLKKLVDELWEFAYTHVEDKGELDNVRYKMYELGIGLDDEESRLDFQHRKLLEMADELQQHGTFVDGIGQTSTDSTMCDAATAMRVAANTINELKDRLTESDSTNEEQD